jgi:hypothetical protein
MLDLFADIIRAYRLSTDKFYDPEHCNLLNRIAIAAVGLPHTAVKRPQAKVQIFSCGYWPKLGTQSVVICDDNLMIKLRQVKPVFCKQVHCPRIRKWALANVAVHSEPGQIVDGLKAFSASRQAEINGPRLDFNPAAGTE